MSDAMEDIATYLNGLSGDNELPQVWVDEAVQGANPPYIVVKRINPQLERYFGGACQRIDFQLSIHDVNYSAAVADAIWAYHAIIIDKLDLHEMAGYNTNIVHRLAPPRTNVDAGNTFSLVQAWQFYFKE